MPQPGDAHHRLFRNILNMLGGQAARMLVQAFYFVALARVLGADGFGIFSAAIALAAIATPFSSLGSNILMIRASSREPGTRAEEWQRAGLYTVIGGTLFGLLITTFSGILMPAGLGGVWLFLVLISDLVGMKLMETAAAYWQSTGRSVPLLVWPVVLNGLRLAGVFVALSTDSSLVAWSLAYFVASVPFGLAVSAYTTWQLGIVRRLPRMSQLELKEGLLFSVGLSSQTVYNDIDKAMLARLGSAASAGIYAAAYRLVDMAYVPIRAISATTYPRFFQAGAVGINGSLALVRRVAPLTMGYAALAAMLLAVVAPLVPAILGSEFDGTEQLLPFLALVLVTRGATYLAGDALSGANVIKERTVVQVAIAALNIVLNFLLIPTWGVWGAVLSTLLCESMLAIALWAIVVFKWRKSRA